MLGAPIYLHPRAPGRLHAAAYPQDHLEHAICGYAAETGLHGLRLNTGGAFDRFPNLRVILGHMGEGIPYWLYRIDYMHGVTSKIGMERPQIERRPSEYFRENFFITASGVNWNPPLKYCIEVLGIDKVMFAVDYPYHETFEALEWMNGAPLGDADKALVFGGNVERIFGLQP